MSPAPRITLALLAYKQSAFIDASVRSALAQQCEPIEIVLSDDASPDDTFEKMQALAAAYTGPHTVVARRNARNLGICEHGNTVCQASRGQLIVWLAGDDIATPDRVARIAQAWSASGEKLDLIASHLIDMGIDGQTLGEIHVDDLSAWQTAHDWVQRRPYVVGAGFAMTRRLYEQFGPMSPQVLGEDQVMAFRAILAGGASTVNAPLVHYRRGGISGKYRPRSPQEMAQRLLKGNRNALAELAQMLADAQRVGQDAVVRPHIERQLAREYFIRDMFAAASLKARLALLAGTSSVSLSLRWRMLSYTAFPQALVPFFWLKRRLRRQG